MEWNNSWSLQLQNRLIIRKMNSSFGMTNAYTSFVVFHESIADGKSQFIYNNFKPNICFSTSSPITDLGGDAHSFSFLYSLQAL